MIPTCLLRYLAAPASDRPVTFAPATRISPVSFRNASHGDEWRHDYLPFSERAVAMGWRSNRHQVGVMPRATAANAMAAIAAATDKSNLGSIAPRLAISDGKANSVGRKKIAIRTAVMVPAKATANPRLRPARATRAGDIPSAINVA